MSTNSLNDCYKRKITLERTIGETGVERTLVNYVINENETYSTVICNELLEMIADNSKLRNYVSEKNKICILNFIRDFYKYIVNDIGYNKKVTIENLFANRRKKIYMVETYDSKRTATEKEIEQGVESLSVAFRYAFEEKETELLCCLGFVITGKEYYFDNAMNDRTVKFSEDSQYTNFVSLSTKLNEMLTYFKENSAKQFLKDLSKKAKDLRVPLPRKFAEDEVTENISAKQIIEMARYKLSVKDDDKFRKRACAIILNRQKYGKEFLPEEIAFIRKVVNRYKDIEEERKVALQEQEKPQPNMEVYRKCSILRECKAQRLIDPSQFVFKVIGTLEKNNFTKCSEKQMKIIDESLKDLERLGVNINKKDKVKSESKDLTLIIDDIDKYMKESEVYEETDEESNTSYEDMMMSLSNSLGSDL